MQKNSESQVPFGSAARVDRLTAELREQRIALEMCSRERYQLRLQIHELEQSRSVSAQHPLAQKVSAWTKAHPR